MRPPRSIAAAEKPQAGNKYTRKTLAMIAAIGALVCLILASSLYLMAWHNFTSAGNPFAIVGAGVAAVAATPSLGSRATPQAIVTLEPDTTSAPKLRAAADYAGAVIFRDNFDDPQSSDFAEADNENANYTFVDGAYVITVKKPKLLCWATIKGNYANASIAVEINIDGSKKSAAGLIFHYQDDKNFYIFTIDGENRYELDVYTDNKPTTLIDWTESSAIKPAGQTNKLRLETNGDTIRLYANDKLLDEISDSTIMSGKTALVVNTFDDPNVTVKFDNLIVREVK